MPVDRRIRSLPGDEQSVSGFATQDVSLRSDDRTRFLAWYEATLPEVHHYLMRVCAFDRPLAEDLTQDTYVAALARLRHAPFDELSIGWLMVVARNKLVDHLRRKEREHRRFHLVHDPEVVTPSESADLGELLRSLPSAQRAAIALRYVDDLPVDEVARLLNRSRKATESLLSRARETLRRQNTGCHEDG